MASDRCYILNGDNLLAPPPSFSRLLFPGRSETFDAASWNTTIRTFMHELVAAMLRPDFVWLTPFALARTSLAVVPVNESEEGSEEMD